MLETVIPTPPAPAAADSARQPTGLRQDALPFSETLAQSVANIAPSGTPALALALVFASAGAGTWLSYAIATLGLVFVGMNINQFARRSATPGSLYSYTTDGMGPTAGFVAGWGLLVAYLATGVGMVFGFTIFAQGLLASVGIDVPAPVLFAVDAALIWFLAYRDISLSAKAMLAIELASMGVILALAAVVLAKSPVKFDAAQMALEGISFDGIRTGLVLAIFSFVGFESATSLGAEARDPLRTIPRAVTGSTLLVGAFFVLMSYVEVLGFRGASTSLAASQEPLSVIAERFGVPVFGLIISIGALVSFFACGLACVNAVSRILFMMGRDGVLHASVGRAHADNETPHVAVTLASAVMLAGALAFTLGGVAMLDGFSYIGSIAVFGFLLTYVLVSVAAPVFLRRRGELRPRHLVTAVIGVGFMMIPVVGSLSPITAGPNGLPPFPYVFAAYMLLGAGWAVFAGRRAAAVA